MAANLLSIAEASHEIQIDEEKLRYICSKLNVCDDYGITKSQYVSLSNQEKLRMLKGFKKFFFPVYFSNSKRLFCCNDYVLFDDGKNHDCLKYNVNVLACTCFFCDEKVVSENSSGLTMNSALDVLEKEQK